MRGIICRSTRLYRFAVLGLAVAVPTWAATTQPTQTTISTETHDQAGRTRAAVSVSVTGQDGLPAQGAVEIQDNGQPIGGAALSKGQADISVNLLPGSHSLRAVYAGDTAHQSSVSASAAVTAQTTSTPDFNVSVNPGSVSLTAGQSGQVTVSVTPISASALTAPMFVTLSCAGMPDQSSCTFTPENIEILPNATAAVTSDMVIATQALGTRGSAKLLPARNSSPVAWAILFPGGIMLAGFAFGTRRRRWLSRVSLVLMIGFICVMGTSACSPQYNYYNHGPNYNLPTPSGSYTLTVTAQSSNGITATTHYATVGLTVK